MLMISNAFVLHVFSAKHLVTAINCVFAALVGLGGVGTFAASPLRYPGRWLLRHSGRRAPEEGAPVVGLLIFATKNMQLSQAMEDASAFVGPETILLAERTQYKVFVHFLQKAVKFGGACECQ